MSPIRKRLERDTRFLDFERTWHDAIVIRRSKEKRIRYSRYRNCEVSALKRGLSERRTREVRRYVRAEGPVQRFHFHESGTSCPGSEETEFGDNRQLESRLRSRERLDTRPKAAGIPTQALPVSSCPTRTPCVRSLTELKTLPSLPRSIVAIRVRWRNHRFICHCFELVRRWTISVATGLREYPVTQNLSCARHPHVQFSQPYGNE